MVEDSDGSEIQPFVLVMPEEGNESLSSRKVRGAIPAVVDRKKEEFESLTTLKAEIHQLERALHLAHIRPSPPPDTPTFVPMPGLKMLHGDTNVAACSKGVRRVGNEGPTSNFNSGSSSSHGVESNRPPCYQQVSTRHIIDVAKTEDISHGLKSVLSTDSLQFRLKDDGTGAYMIAIGKGVLKQYRSLEINPSARTLTLRM